MKALAMVLLLAASSVEARQFIIYTTTYLPPIALNGWAGSVYHLDTPDLMMRGLSRHQDITANTDETKVMGLLLQREGQDFFERLNDQFMGVVSAWQHGVEYLPAIVVDDRWIVYGVYSIREAEAMASQYERGGR